MQNSFYNIPRPCFVYMLLLNDEDDDSYYFVGRSFGASISKIYSRHIHGGIAATRNIFTVDARPKLYILQDRPLTGDDAYRYIIAYTKYFSENALGDSLNYDGTEWQSKFMKPETAKIYQEISREPLSDLLRRAYAPRAVDADRKREESLAEHEKKRLVQLNVAVYEDDKALFTAFCKKTGATRRDGFGMLLEAATTKTTEKYEQIVIKKEKKIEAQSKEIKKLEHKLALATGEELPKKEMWASTMYPFMLEGIKRYIDVLFPKREVVHPIHSRPYKGFTRTLLPNEEYVYPEKEGFYLIQLQAVLWGKNKSCFYIGVDAKGRRYRMRYYDKDWFLGIPPRGSGYDEQGSIWVCGVVRTADGSMDLVAALPLPHINMNCSTPKGEKDCPTGQLQKPALSDRIADIEGRSV